jgi:hypothetical protein
MSGRAERHYEKLMGQLRERVPEPVLGGGIFTMGGATMSAVLSVAGPSRKIGGGVKLPKIMAIAVTPSSLRVFAVKVAGYTGGWKVRDEVVAWPRATTKVEFERGSGMDHLTIATPDGHVVGLEAMRMAAGGFNDAFVDAIGGEPPPSEANAEPTA